jgi:hypothetical protein
MADLLGEESGRDHARDGSPRLEDGVGDESHQADGATAVDELDLALGKHSAEDDRRPR